MQKWYWKFPLDVYALGPVEANGEKDSRAKGGTIMTLYINEAPAYVGEVYLTFRGEPVTLLHMVPPHKPSSSGRVYVQYENGATGEYFPHVIGGVWR